MEERLQVIPHSTGAFARFSLSCGMVPVVLIAHGLLFSSSHLLRGLITCPQYSMPRTISQYISPPASASVACKQDTYLVDYSSDPFLESWVLEDEQQRSCSQKGCPDYEQDQLREREELGLWEGWEVSEVFAVNQVRHLWLTFCIQLPFVWPVSQPFSLDACMKVLSHRIQLSQKETGFAACCFWEGKT